MNRSIKGIPVVLFLFVLVIILPLLGADFAIFKAVKKPVTATCPQVVVEKPIMVTAAPTVTPTVTKSLLKRFVAPNATSSAK